MFKRLLTISLMLAFLASVSMAQQKRIVLAPGNGNVIAKLDGKVSVRDALKKSIIKDEKGNVYKHYFPGTPETAAGTIDTLSYNSLFTGAVTNFVMDGHDVEMTWFVAPADLIIKAAGASASDIASNVNGAQAEVRLIKLNWTAAELGSVPAPFYMGYYPSDGDGMNNADHFGEEATGAWINTSDNANNPAGYDFPVPPWADDADPDNNGFEYDLWSDGGFGWPFSPEEQRDADGNPDVRSYQWVEMSNLGFEPEVASGEVFAVVIKNNGVAWDDGATPDRFGWWSKEIAGLWCWKYYEAGRLAAEEPGWWARKYTWNFAVVADLVGDRAPVIQSVSSVATTLSTDPQTVEAMITDDNPGGGAAGIQAAEIMYSLDGGDYQSVAMSDMGGDMFSGDIPGQSPGTNISYYVKATDVGGLSVESVSFAYKIFAATQPNLLVFNGHDGTGGYPQAYYFGIGDFATYEVLDWPHDSWNYGVLTTDLLSNYTNVFEIATNGPSVINSDAIAEWLAGDGNRNYALAGDEWLGSQSGWANQEYAAGDFQFDVLGMTADYNDVNYAATGDQNLPSVVMPVADTELGGELAALYAQVSSDNSWTADMVYDPFYEIEVTNWLDGADWADDVEVFMQGVGIDGATYNIAGSRTLAGGNKIATMLFDPLSLDSHGDDGSQYHWYGFTSEAPQVQTLWWFGITVGINDDMPAPDVYALAQNYPNPFNPSTKIAFSVPSQGNVTLKVYNMLGQEVATLLNEVKSAGVHEVAFDGINLTSGVYFYTLSSGQFVSTKKMMLIK